jgi:hypothetical protein
MTLRGVLTVAGCCLVRGDCSSNSVIVSAPAFRGLRSTNMAGWGWAKPYARMMKATRAEQRARRIEEKKKLAQSRKAYKAYWKKRGFK